MFCILVVEVVLLTFVKSVELIFVVSSRYARLASLIFLNIFLFFLSKNKKTHTVY